MSNAGDGKIGFWAVVAIGIDGMVGGGIFAVLGLAVQLARGGTSVAFALAGVVALLTTYSYAKLSVAYPSRGGTVTFLDRAFGAGMFTGSLNILLWLSYVVMLSLYALAFGSNHLLGPTRCPDDDFDEIFTRDKPVIFSFHGYPWLVHRLTYRRTNRNLHTRGYKEEATITTAFDMRVKDIRIKYKQYIDKHGQDMPEIRNWKWSNPK
jgi:amino acid transporter